MNQSELLHRLQKQKKDLLSARVQFFWNQPDKTTEQIHKFGQYCDSIKIACETLETSILQDIAKKLEANEKDFEAGCDNLEKEIEALNNTIGFLNSLSRVIGIVGRIIPLV